MLSARGVDVAVLPEIHFINFRFPFQLLALQGKFNVALKQYYHDRGQFNKAGLQKFHDEAEVVTSIYRHVTD